MCAFGDVKSPTAIKRCSETVLPITRKDQEMRRKRRFSSYCGRESLVFRLGRIAYNPLSVFLATIGILYSYVSLWLDASYYGLRCSAMSCTPFFQQYYLQLLTSSLLDGIAILVIGYSVWRLQGCPARVTTVLRYLPIIFAFIALQASAMLPNIGAGVSGPTTSAETILQFQGYSSMLAVLAIVLFVVGLAINLLFRGGIKGPIGIRLNH